MRIVQVLPNITKGDAVSNNCLAIDKILTEAGYDTKIYARMISDYKFFRGKVKFLTDLPSLGRQDILFYHMAIALNKDLHFCKGRKLFQYHNITPPEFFRKYEPSISVACQTGLDEMRSLKNVPDLCLADSEFNRNDLIKAGYKCPIHTVPILIPFEDYDKPADKNIIEQYKDGKTNILFVGRVVPNKAHEDLIRTFAWYQKHINPESRLILIGNTSLRSYYNQLMKYAELLGVKDLVIPGHISFSAILGFYKAADVFLCMSLHEGFCVPLLEAMHFQVPVIARSTTAVPYTLKDAGILLEDNNPVIAAMMIDKVVTDPRLREQIIRKQNERLEFFSYENVKQMILKEIKAFV